jgi:hypothetical protein
MFGLLLNRRLYQIHDGETVTAGLLEVHVGRKSVAEYRDARDPEDDEGGGDKNTLLTFLNSL